MRDRFAHLHSDLSDLAETDANGAARVGKRQAWDISAGAGLLDLQVR
jgi:hypothetical protein